MKKSGTKIIAIVAFVMFLVGISFPMEAFAEELYKENTVTIPLDYTDFQYAEVEMPSDGYIVISQEETMISIGIDTSNESKAKRIYGEETYKVNLKKGTHKIYLFDGAGAQFLKNEYATIHYQIYVAHIDEDNGGGDGVLREGDYKYYIIDESSCGIKSYVGQSSEVVIPSEINEYTVTVIGKKCFAGKDFIEKIEMPKCVKKIEDKAFSDCYGLAVFTFESESKLQKIGKDVFSDCENLEQIVIPKNVSKIENGTFYECKKLSSITFESGDNLKKIGKQAFAECTSLKKIIIPKSVQKIEEEAFNNCKNMVSISFQAGSKLQSVGEEAFAGCLNLKKIVIPQNFVTIGMAAFYNCKSMTSLTFASGSKLRKISEDAFSGCKQLKKVKLTSKSIKYMGVAAFYGISKKAVIKVPRNMKTKYEKMLRDDAEIKSSVKVRAIK